MGPPPNQEDMLAMMDNPMFASQINEAMNNPAVIQMMQNNPMIRNNPMMRQMLENPEMRRMLMDPAIIRQSIQMQRAMGGQGGGSNANAMPAPGVTDTTLQGAAGTTRNTTAAETTTSQPSDSLGSMFGQGGAGGNPFGSLFGNTAAQGGNASSGTTGSEPTSQQPNPFSQLFGGGGQGRAGGQSPFNPEAMRQMMEMMGGGGGAGAGGFNPFGMGGMGGQPAAPAVQDTRPPEEQYSEQLRQLNEMGFYEFDRNVRALRMAGGNVQGAIELLFSGTAGL